jgi:hypothetical protein
MWERAEDILTPEDLKNYLAKDIMGRTACYAAADRGYLYMLHRVRDWQRTSNTREGNLHFVITQG